MAKYRIDSIAQLQRQLTFTPLATRLAQIIAAEDLLHSLDPAKAYPLELVIFRITGYRPKAVARDLLTGLALQHDLGLLIERLSDTLNLHTTSLPEPVLTIDDVSERFNVTSKTIQRWRRRGLPARRFLFPDGKRRIGFLVRSVERFFSNHRERIDGDTNFSPISPTETEEILRRARRLADLRHCSQQEISRRIARKMNRSPLAILHTIRKHDQEHPADSIFARSPEPLDPETAARIVRGFRHGISLRRLARKTHGSRAAIYRVIMEDRLERLARRKIRFIDDPLYHESEARQTMCAMLQQQELAAPQRPEDSRVPRDLPPYLEDLYRTPLLTPARERAFFLKFNFHKYQFVQARRRLEPQFARNRHLHELEAHLRDVTETKNAIVRANLRLVVSVARKHLRPSLSLMELISDGNMTLMRAVESFDAHRGNRFSTYATLALMKGFARSVPMMLAAGQSAHAEVLANLADSRATDAVDRNIERDAVHHMLDRLEERERAVLRAHYGLGESAPATYEQLGRRLGISKQRVRQIEKRAIAKLRAM